MRLTWCSVALPDLVPAAPKARRVGEALPGQTDQPGCHQAGSRRGLRVGQPRLGTEQPRHQTATARRHRPDAGMPERAWPQRDNRTQSNRRPYRSRQTKHPGRPTLLLRMSSAPARTVMCVRQAAPLIQGATIINGCSNVFTSQCGRQRRATGGRSGNDRHGFAFMCRRPIWYWIRASQTPPGPSAERCTGIR